jgi:predicted nucleic acid-binding protein
MIDFDANFLVDVFERGSASGRLLDRWVRRGELLSMSSMAWAEFLCGPVASGNARAARELLGAIEPVTEADAVLAAELFNATGRRVRSLADCIIAAVAIRRRAQLATLDKADFNRFQSRGLQLA